MNEPIPKKLSSLEEIYEVFERQLITSPIVIYALYDKNNKLKFIHTTKYFLSQLYDYEHIGMLGNTHITFPKFRNVNFTHDSIET